MSAVAITIQALLAASGVTALTGTHVYPIKAPQNATTSVVVHLIHEADDLMLTGPHAEYYRARVQIDCRADTATKVMALGEAVKAALGNIVRRSFASGKATFFKEGSEAMQAIDEPALYRRHMDYKVFWRKT